MNRYVCLTFSLALLLTAAMEVRADILVSTVDLVTFQPSGVQRYDEWTGTRLPLGDIPANVTGLGLPYFPSSMTLTSDGRLFLADSGGAVMQFDAATSTPLSHPSGQLPAGAFAFTEQEMPTNGFPSLTVGPDSMLYVVDGDDVSGNGGKPGIRVYDPDTGAQVNTLLESATVEFARLTAIAFDANGDLLLSDFDDGTIYKVDVENDTIESFITQAPGEPVAPTGMFVDASGNIFVSHAPSANPSGHALLQYDPDGTNPTVLATLPPVDGGVVSSPSNMWPNRAGDGLLVAGLGFGTVGTGQVLQVDFAGSPATAFLSGIAPASAVIVVPDLLPGDFNGDGNVDSGDYLKWKVDFGSSVIPTSGADGNGDGLVDIADYTIWRNTLGATGLLPDSAGLATNIPEPSTAWIVGVTLLGVACRYRRRISC